MAFAFVFKLYLEINKNAMDNWQNQACDSNCLFHFSEHQRHFESRIVLDVYTVLIPCLPSLNRLYKFLQCEKPAKPVGAEVTVGQRKCMCTPWEAIPLPNHFQVSCRAILCILPQKKVLFSIDLTSRYRSATISSSLQASFQMARSHIAAESINAGPITVFFCFYHPDVTHSPGPAMSVFIC